MPSPTAQSKKPSSDQALSSLLKGIRTAGLFVHAKVKSKNVQFTDIKCIDYLVDVHSATAGKLAEVTGLTTGATTAMIDRLEAEGLVKRTPDSTDRRKIIITFMGKVSPETTNDDAIFLRSISNLLDSYTQKDQLLITQWSAQLTQLLENEIKKLHTNKKQ